MGQTIITANRIVGYARACVNTKFHHQGRLLGVGMDCFGPLAYVAEELGIDLGNIPTNYATMVSDEHSMQTLAALDKSLQRILHDDIEPGDVLFFWITRRNKPCHLGIVTDTASWFMRMAISVKS